MTYALEKARELGKAIAESIEYIELKEAEERLLGSESSTKLFRAMSESDEKRESALKDELVARYVECQNHYDSLMRDINTIISYYTGYTAVKGNCGSCGGCGSQSL